MQDTLAPVSQTAVTGELQTSGSTKTLLPSMTELRIAGSLVRRWGSTAQPPRSCAGCFSLKVGTECGNHAENVPRATFEPGFTILGLMIFTMTMLAFFCRVHARNVETHPILGIVRVASIGGVTSAIGAIPLPSPISIASLDVGSYLFWLILAKT